MVDTPISATTPSTIIHGSGSDSLPEEFRMESGRSVIEKSFGKTRHESEEGPELNPPILPRQGTEASYYWQLSHCWVSIPRNISWSICQRIETNTAHAGGGGGGGGGDDNEGVTTSPNKANRSEHSGICYG
ncbi:hypothetical protein PAAG_05597 [Paracoccidioides lutzii Pb01]|uniref:Uncharacterized protein n=1 Tax=Paracoccidioides lutzii (strain ATCC MYA-826 / Pb01) TaxID=502779 RepID=C1H4A4_PARBA|nr:hypothetical protein PAAG_05597 [Paracoccidioides lutzii Pb01]EEH34548.2 hypothetical protein PAAG_05597 [Paracoccidioides lutzii Pb01]